MVTNSVSPFEGALVWVGTPYCGTSQTTGQPWKVVDFVINYTDHKMQEQHMVLTASGVERVDKLLSTPLGTILRVDFTINARKSDYNGQEKWWGSLTVFRITPVTPQAQSAPQAQPQPQPSFQQYPQQQAAFAPQPFVQPVQQPIQQPVAPPPVVDEQDLPF
jgi:hypothetical protein